MGTRPTPSAKEPHPAVPPKIERATHKPRKMGTAHLSQGPVPSRKNYSLLPRRGQSGLYPFFAPRSKPRKMGTAHSVPRPSPFAKELQPTTPPWTEWAVPTFRPALKTAKNGDCLLCPKAPAISTRRYNPLRRRGQSGLYPLFAPRSKLRKMGTACSVPRRPQFQLADITPAPPWTERAVPTFRPAIKTAKNGDCLLCPKAPAISTRRYNPCAAVDRAGCTHFSPRPQNPEAPPKHSPSQPTPLISVPPSPPLPGLRAAPPIHQQPAISLHPKSPNPPLPSPLLRRRNRRRHRPQL